MATAANQTNAICARPVISRNRLIIFAPPQPTAARRSYPATPHFIPGRTFFVPNMASTGQKKGLEKNRSCRHALGQRRNRQLRRRSNAHSPHVSPVGLRSSHPRLSATRELKRDFEIVDDTADQKHRRLPDIGSGSTPNHLYICHDALQAAARARISMCSRVSSRRRAVRAPTSLSEFADG
jgi:hypothetical protein